MMNRHVNAIAGRLSLRPPQRRSLEILDRITEIAPPKKGSDVKVALEAIRSEFPSLCFALATGVGKTRLMGAFIAYLHLAHRYRARHHLFANNKSRDRPGIEQVA
jgi:type III restriction enzyme